MVTSSSVSEAELQATVERMERRWIGETKSPAVSVLVAAYPLLCARFEADLGASRRDVLLARSAALMLIQAVAADDAAS